MARRPHHGVACGILPGAVTLRTVLARRALVEALLLLVVTANAGAGPRLGMTAALRTGITPGIRIRCAFAIAGGKHDLELDDFVPLRVGPLLLGDCEQCLQALTR